jgi:hypothetical protein
VLDVHKAKVRQFVKEGLRAFIREVFRGADQSDSG